MAKDMPGARPRVSDGNEVSECVPGSERRGRVSVFEIPKTNPNFIL